MASNKNFISGKPIAVACAYTGRIAVAYRSKGKRPYPSATNSKFFNLCVAIFECESTGENVTYLRDIS